MKFIVNETVDFISAVKRFADRNKPQDPGYPRSPEIEEWCSKYEKILSPFLLNDISLMVEKMIMPTIYLFHFMWNNKTMDTAEKMLIALKNISVEEFVQFIQKEFPKEVRENLSEEAIFNSLIDDGLFPNHDPVEEAKLFFGFLKDPENFLSRLHKTYSEFYTQAYLPGKKALEKLSQEKFRWHETRLRDNGIQYLRHLGLGSLLKEVSDWEQLTLFFSMFADNEISTFWMTRKVIIGGYTDQRILGKSARDKTDIFFSCASDPKRLEIMRLTAQRPWYSTELAKHFDLKPATLSYHINKLADAELLDITKGESRRFYYSLNRDEVKKYMGYISQDLLGLKSEKE
ncbi:MAG: winged helix-turn-helix transcriptional regulator [Spirochaetales bacterium]|nr:winged helix-turn-helix transcriptional regulator [Spirochaetales bacterium]